MTNKTVEELDPEAFNILSRENMLSINKSGMAVGSIPKWAMYGLATTIYFEKSEYYEIYQWCKDNFVGKYKFRSGKCPDLVDIFVEKEEDLLIFKLRW